MKIKRIAAVYAIIMGISMMGIWIMFYVTGSVPEIQTKPVELGMHLAAEYATAILLLIGGGGLLAKKKWANSVHLLSMGMLLYTLIMSPGYFAQKGEMAFVGMFAAFTIAAVAILIGSIRQEGTGSA